MSVHTQRAGKFVVFCTPSLDGRVSMEFFESSIRTEHLLHRCGISTGYRQVSGDQFIAKARNRLVTDFLVEFPTATDLFFVDDDISWPAEKVRDFIARREMVVCGVYPKKSDSPSYPVEMETKDGKLIRQNGLFSAILAPTGFMRIKRPLLEAMVKNCRTYMEVMHDGSKKLSHNLFEAGLLPTGADWVGEDYDFCQKVRSMGETIWVDPDITFTHRGPKKWTGCLNEPLQAHIAVHEAPELVNG